MIRNVMEVDKPRKSNMELLRIVAMFMVLFNHVIRDLPDTVELHSNLFESASQYLIEAACIGAVDVFVMISGWFGIRASLKGLSKFIFQVMFFYITIYALLVLTGNIELTKKGLLYATGVVSASWFIPAYTGLYILSPVLNAFAETANRKTYKHVLIIWFIFQTINGYFGWQCSQFSGGYSIISFVGLYLFAQYLHRYSCKLTNRNATFHFSCYIVCVLLIAVLAAVPVYFDSPFLFYTPWNYLDPFIICGSTAILLMFSKMHIQNRKINFIAASAFSVYLIHTMPCTWGVFYAGLDHALSICDFPLSVLCVIVYVTLIYLFALVYDQIRKLFWDILLKFSRSNTY